MAVFICFSDFSAGMLRLSYRKEEDAPSHEKARAAQGGQGRPRGEFRYAVETEAADPPSEAGVVPHHSYRRVGRSNLHIMSTESI